MTVTPRAQMPEAEDDLDLSDSHTRRRRADFLTIDAGPDEDPFDTSLVLTTTTGDHPVAVTLPLTPATLTDLIAALSHIHHAQLEQLGLTSDHDPDAEASSVSATTPTDDSDEQSDSGGRVRGLIDPLGARHLRDRVTRPALLVGVVVALMAFGLILQILR